MPRYLARRIVQSLVTIFGVVTVAFFLVRLSGNPAALLLGPDASAADVDELSKTLGFDDPLVVQYGRFLGDAVTGDLGMSLKQNIPSLDLVAQRLPATLELASTGFVLGIAAAFAVVMILQYTDSARLRAAVLWFASARQAIPSFWLGVMLVMVFAVTLRMFPALGNNSPLSIVLPAITIATLECALYIRLLDTAFVEQRSADYVRTAYAKGQRRGVVLLRHMLPNAVLPVITVAGINLGVLLGGSIVVELVFNWPGIGQLLIQSIAGRDYTVVQTSILVIALFFVVVNLAVDLLYSVIDPRVRLK
ncbi:ABC transporter permease [Nocardia jinanensis]|uniref:Peptide ABC transporter permease n=1 Tax=Nocardia jinanensis TaxID=382504 RepID=A0A917RDA3_9NOCA|nr:ABC transporter permease [Nocardia jinanensis]GGL02367.1 peptide ABC transporter permease [Nocardia jinanensis]